MSLQAFYKDNAIQADTTTEIVVSDRFKDDNGNPIKWKIRALKPKRFMKLTSGSIKLTEDGSVDMSETDAMNFQLLTETIEYPNLKDVELQNSYGVMGTADLLDAMLTTPEFQLLSKKVNDLHMVNKSTYEMADEVKNS